ncbi:hypothetical protein CYMTET_3217 [Cymbomonas tetramitiformis]|uniref:Uncharacterized protein n=1 Tax=Cymbomonas tetramitiformis TaxID=36881 RepID=A0AAE0H3P5_9CHLO|nr:hypothetical protein CYMTET_3217 [Cymbomonas tetramitiformis]
MDKVMNGATAATLGKTEVLVTITENPTQGMSKGITPKCMLTMFLASFDGVPISIVVWNTGIYPSLPMKQKLPDDFLLEFGGPRLWSGNFKVFGDDDTNEEMEYTPPPFKKTKSTSSSPSIAPRVNLEENVPKSKAVPKAKAPAKK